jgi:hypothetical protein
LHELVPLGPRTKLLLAGLVVLTLWGTAVLGSRALYRTRRETALLTEQTMSVLQAERLQAATEGSNIWLWETDRTGRLIWDLNPPAVLGLAALPDAATRVTCMTYVDLQDLDSRPQLYAAIRHGRPITQRFRSPRPRPMGAASADARPHLLHGRRSGAAHPGRNHGCHRKVHRNERLAQVQIQQTLHRASNRSERRGL